MTPKEKAKELVEKYDSTLTYLESKLKAKQCALIAVEEIETVLLQERVFESLDYWKEVQQEIELL